MKEPRKVFSIDVRNDLVYAIADLFHVLQSEIPESIEDEMFQQVWVFDQIWKEVNTAVARGQEHYVKDAVEPDEFAEEIVVIDDNERNYNANHK